MKNVIGNFSDKWYQEDGFFARGVAFLDGKQKSEDGLVSSLKGVADNDIPEFLYGSNGFFSAVRIGENGGWMAVDRIRSIPVFYGNREGNLYISDDAKWIRKQVRDIDMDPVAKQEFLLTGYVTGPDTLFSGVKQLQAGEMVYIATGDNGEATLQTKRYFRYFHHDYFKENDASLHKRLDNVLKGVFGRLIDYAAGRTIVVPLSGGYDSRLIVLMLKHLGYDNIVAFSYGRPGNNEAVASRKIAEQLKLRWEFVPYSNEQWYSWYRSQEMLTYFDYADGLSSLPHIQDWPAVWTLREKGLVPEDSVFVPGHTGDKVTGGLSKASLRLYKGERRAEAIVSDIIRCHYSLYEYKPRASNSFSARKRILRTLGNLSRYPDGSSAFESWDITERQPKFIVNSIRIYEFWRYDWWIPLWDKEFVDYWRRIHPSKRVNQGLYIAYINDLAEKMGISVKKEEARKACSSHSSRFSMLVHTFIKVIRFVKIKIMPNLVLDHSLFERFPLILN